MFLPPTLIRDLDAAQRAESLRRAARNQLGREARLLRQRPDRTRPGPPLRARLWRFFQGPLDF